MDLILKIIFFFHLGHLKKDIFSKKNTQKHQVVVATSHNFLNITCMWKRQDSLLNMERSSYNHLVCSDQISLIFTKIELLKKKPAYQNIVTSIFLSVRSVFVFRTCWTWQSATKRAVHRFFFLQSLDPSRPFNCRHSLNIIGSGVRKLWNWIIPGYGSHAILSVLM